jgi:hypothetical protein
MSAHGRAGATGLVRHKRVRCNSDSSDSCQSSEELEGIKCADYQFLVNATSLFVDSVVASARMGCVFGDVTSLLAADETETFRLLHRVKVV